MILRRENASLLPFNTFGIDVTARELIEYDSEQALRQLAPLESFLHVGEGSNLLFTRPYDGTVLHSRICFTEVLGESADGSVAVRVGAGVMWDDLVAWAVVSGLSGIENLSLIPGEVGAAAVQNIGAYGVELKDVVTAVNTVDMHTGLPRRFTREECDYGYRDSVFKRTGMKRYAVTSVELELSRTYRPVTAYRALTDYMEQTGLEPSPEAVRRAVIHLRRGKLPEPAKLGNAGSFFTNPVVSVDKARELASQWPGMPEYPADGGVKLSAGWLIDRAGWKGRSMGRAGVYERQALVLVNLGGASGSEIVRLANAVVASVREQFGVTLTPEVNIF